MATTARVNDIVETARPYVDRLAHDKKLQENLRNAFSSAQKIYTGLATEEPSKHAAVLVASDPDLRNELGSIVGELRSASERVRARESHRSRNRLMLLAFVGALALFNPMTGPQTRRWLKDRIFGQEPQLDYDYSAG